MRKWFLIMAAALVLCSACGKKDTSVNGVTQEAQASSTEAESLYKEGAGYVGEEDYESIVRDIHMKIKSLHDTFYNSRKEKCQILVDNSFVE